MASGGGGVRGGREWKRGGDGCYALPQENKVQCLSQVQVTGGGGEWGDVNTQVYTPPPPPLSDHPPSPLLNPSFRQRDEGSPVTIS
jgi:hypothetical protein